ncbi:MAG TPA: hypothetical protein VJQ79_13680 [Acidimicrobiia bacterium]|nr:hypothetical protein [Acidimicrobiia bacterium]
MGTVRHALDHTLTVIDLEPDADPRPLASDRARNLLEIIWLELADEVNLVIHATPLRPAFYDLLPRTREDMP